MNTWAEIYTRCMDGEYFRGRTCPVDGSHNDISFQVADLVAAMRTDGVAPSLQGLVERGFDGSLDEVIVLQVASRDAAPDWFRTGKGMISAV